MTERDPRWEKMFARIGTPEIHPSDEENGYAETLRMHVEMRIEVRYEGTLWHVVQQLHKDDYEHELLRQPDIYKWFLDEMVRIMDEYLEGKRQ